MVSGDSMAAAEFSVFCFVHSFEVAQRAGRLSSRATRRRIQRRSRTCCESVCGNKYGSNELKGNQFPLAAAELYAFAARCAVDEAEKQTGVFLWASAVVAAARVCRLPPIKAPLGAHTQGAGAFTLNAAGQALSELQVSLKELVSTQTC